MAIVATRLQNDGTLLLNGEFDEYTYNGNITFESSTTNSSVFVTGAFDEVTYNISAPVIKNLLTYTQDFTNAAWTNYQQFANSVIITGNVVSAPDNSITASKFASNNAGASFYSFYRSSGVIAANTDYVFSTYFKAGERTTGSMTLFTDLGGNNSIFFNLTTGAITGTIVVDSALTMSGNIVSAGDNWYRIWYTFRRTSQSNGQFKYQLDSGNIPVGQGYYVWGAQHELGTTPSIYQPIAGANTLVNTGMSQRVDSSGNQYVSNIFDEFTGAPVIDGNVVLWLDAGQTTSYPGTGTVWTNLANNSANTTLVNSPTFDSQGWFSFNGTTQSANTGFPGSTTFTTDSDFTITCWARFDAYKVAANSIGTLTGAFNYQGYGLFWTGTPSTYTLGSYMRYVSTVSQNISAAVNLDTWYMVTQCYSRAGNFHRLYINDTLSASTTTISGAFNTNLDSVSIGIASGAGSDGTPGGGTPGTPFLGRVSQVMIYNRALSGDEVAQNFNALRRRYGI